MWKTLALALALAGCAGTASTPSGRPLSNAVPRAAGTGALFNIEVGSLGPITPHTPANQAALQELLGGRYIVKGVDSMGLELHVFLGQELLFYVIPNDDGTLFNVHVVSPKVAIAAHPEWVIQSPFSRDELLTTCECWGSHPVCFHTGEHVAVAFDVACDGLDSPAGRHVLSGVPIQRAVWSPKPFGGADPGSSSRPQPPSLSKIFGGDPP